MAGMFSSCYRAAHEPHARELLAIIPAFQQGRISKEDFRRYVIFLDNRSRLEFNASFLNNWQLAVLIAEYPDAKFILTIRDCYSWLNSFLTDLHLKGPQVPAEYKRFLDIILHKGSCAHAREERVLEEYGGYTLDELLMYWARVNNEILVTVPADRLLVIKTQEIIHKSKAIADFLGIPQDTLDLRKSHLNKSVRHDNILAKVDRDYLVSKVNGHCKVLMDTFFPDVVSTFG